MKKDNKVADKMKDIRKKREEAEEKERKEKEEAEANGLIMCQNG